MTLACFPCSKVTTTSGKMSTRSFACLTFPLITFSDSLTRSRKKEFLNWSHFTATFKTTGWTAVIGVQHRGRFSTRKFGRIMTLKGYITYGTGEHKVIWISINLPSTCTTSLPIFHAKSPWSPTTSCIESKELQRSGKTNLWIQFVHEVKFPCIKRLDNLPCDRYVTDE